MTKRLWPRSIKKYLRREKSRIRATVKDLAEQRNLISDLYRKLNLAPKA